MYTYRIDVEARIVCVSDLIPGVCGFRCFDDIAVNFAPGCPRMAHATPGRDEAYRVARDELIERGLIDG